jgi:membrane associated rhomboid family serine protease
MGILPLPALVVLGIWIVMQVVSSVMQPMSGVAFGAHIGGFAAGMALAYLFRRSGPTTTGQRFPPPSRTSRRYPF